MGFIVYNFRLFLFYLITWLLMKTSNLLKSAFRLITLTFKITSFSIAIHLFSSPILSQLQSLLIILFCKSSIMLILLFILVKVLWSPCHVRFAKLPSQYLQISFSLSVLSARIIGFLTYQRISGR